MVAAIRRKTRRSRRTLSAIRAAAPALPMIIGAVMLLGAAPSSQPSEQMRVWFAELADPHAEVRSAAIQSLMGLSADQLPALRNLIEKSLPLQPSQRAVLREIVTEVYTSALEYEVDPANAAFLGLYWPRRGIEPPGDGVDGILIIRRVPGFSAYRMLRDGDIIIGIREIGDERFNNLTRLDVKVQAFRPGQTIHLGILRDGKEMYVAVELRARPIGMDGGMGTEAWMATRRAAADQYWDANFGSLLGDQLSSNKAELMSNEAHAGKSEIGIPQAFSLRAAIYWPV